MLKHLVIILGWMVTTLPANALDKLAVVIGNSSYANHNLRAPAQNAILVSQSLLKLGFEVVRLENANAASQPLGNRSAETVVIYYSGAIAVEGMQTRLLSVVQKDINKPSGWVLDELVRSYQKAGAKQILIFLDTCHADAGEQYRRQALSLDIKNVFQVQAGAPGEMCPAETEATASFTRTIVDAMLTPNVTLSDSLSSKTGIWFKSLLSNSFSFRQQSETAKELSASDLDMLDRLSEQDRKRILDLWRKAGIIRDDPTRSTVETSTANIATVQNDTIILPTSVQPVVISTIQPAATSIVNINTLSQVQNNVRIFNASVTPERQFRPAAVGLPTPSIIVGNIKSEDSFSNPTELGGAISGVETGVLDFKTRQTLRNNDPASFERLLASGAFDPQPDTIAGAIQTELSRMGCYSARIDGIWGKGSRAAVDRYFSQIGIAAPSREPVTAVYRQILRKDNITCPVVQTATQRVSPTTQRRTTRAGATPNNTTRTPPKPAPQTGRRTISKTLNSAGVFR